MHNPLSRIFLLSLTPIGILIFSAAMLAHFIPAVPRFGLSGGAIACIWLLGAIIGLWGVIFRCIYELEKQAEQLSDRAEEL